MKKLSMILAAAALVSLATACDQPSGPVAPPSGPAITETVDCEINGTGGYDLVRRDVNGVELSRRTLGPNESCP